MLIRSVLNLPVSTEHLVLLFKLLSGDTWLNTVRIVKPEAEQVTSLLN